VVLVGGVRGRIAAQLLPRDEVVAVLDHGPVTSHTGAEIECLQVMVSLGLPSGLAAITALLVFAAASGLAGQQHHAFVCS
jgi:hypothetical protein